ncbi:hypothetical protein [Lonepinella sp. BR2882]|uniref:hypothetical protein n=1 Tax=Lonepinella sp. BR2882 TaxID=3095283 RepID=UPI003F6E32F4
MTGAKAVTTLRIAGSKKATVEAMALEIGKKCKRVVKISEVLNFILDEHLKPSVVDQFVEKELRKQLEALEAARENNEDEEIKN